jgi:hypothetical protein
MTASAATDITLVQAIPLPALDPSPQHSKAAIKRCCAAWRRAYNESLKGTPHRSGDKIIAEFDAKPAYCQALPPLAGRENIRDFIACVAHGVLLDAIPERRVNHLLYAAQVALSALNNGPKPKKSS